MIKEFKKTAEEVVREESEKSPMAKKVHASYSKFHSLSQRLEPDLGGLVLQPAGLGPDVRSRPGRSLSGLRPSSFLGGYQKLRKNAMVPLTTWG